jgi:hypothetical protein
MSGYKDSAPDLRANRRREIFRAVRASKLTGQRGKLPGDPVPLAVADSRKALAEDEAQPPRRVRLGGPVEDEAGAAGLSDPRRYSEPND